MTAATPQAGAHFLGADGRLHRIAEVVGSQETPLLRDAWRVRDGLGYLYTLRPAADALLDPAPCEWVEIALVGAARAVAGRRQSQG